MYRSNTAAARAPSRRLQIEVHSRPEDDHLADDVRNGLTAKCKHLPPKYFYDARGSELFDQICNTPEYYPTRTEAALLSKIAVDLLEATRPDAIVELGSGSARKTRVLFDVLAGQARQVTYVPFDVSESMLAKTAHELLEEYPNLDVHGVVGDYDRDLDQIPRISRRLFMFIGSTIGNFTEEHATRFLRSVARQMGPADSLLLGTDLVKPHGVLNAAYNDRQGLTAQFNKNILRVVNRTLGANFDVESFRHVAEFVSEKSRIEMRLRAETPQRVNIADLDLEVPFGAGESILTEISRKFSLETVTAVLAAAGFRLDRWYTPPSQYFALSLATLA